MFRKVPVSIIRSFSLYAQQWHMSYSLGAGSGRSFLILLASRMTYTIGVCTVKNSWWWTEELSETCRILFQKNKFEKLVRLVGFVTRNSKWNSFRIYQTYLSPGKCKIRWQNTEPCNCITRIVLLWIDLYRLLQHTATQHFAHVWC